VLECVNPAVGHHKEVETMAQLRDGSGTCLRLSLRSAAGNLDQVPPPPPSSPSLLGNRNEPHLSDTSHL